LKLQQFSNFFQNKYKHFKHIFFLATPLKESKVAARLYRKAQMQDNRLGGAADGNQRSAK